MNHSKQTRRQRALDLRAFLARHAHLFTLKDVCREAGINYESTSNAIGRLISKNETTAISDERLTVLEDAGIALSNRNENGDTLGISRDEYLSITQIIHE